jgi:peptidoglycan hydrolase FlgJ
MSTDLYANFEGLARLRAEAKTNERAPEVLRKAATQFEALFVQMVLKGMRQANLGPGIFESDQQGHYLDMFDSQIALTLAQGPGLGLADVIVRQLSNTFQTDAPKAGRRASATAEKTSVTATDGRGQSPEAFVQTLWPLAQRTGEQLGVSPKALVAQAALETGWGKAVMRHPDGRNSFNIFGIKASAGWSGDRVTQNTLEYEDGIAVRRRAEFRAYNSYAEAFADYTQLMQTHPRYEQALARGTNPAVFGMELQRAGYATDPAYGRKIAGIARGATLNEALTELKLSARETIT